MNANSLLRPPVVLDASAGMREDEVYSGRCDYCFARHQGTATFGNRRWFTADEFRMRRPSKTMYDAATQYWLISCPDCGGHMQVHRAFSLPTKPVVHVAHGVKILR